MDPESDLLASDEARKQWRSLLDHVEHDDEHIVITRHGRRAAVMVPYDWWERVAVIVNGRPQ